MFKWHLVVTASVVILGGAGCGPVTMQQRAEEAGQSGDWAKAMASFDWEYEHATYGKQKEIEEPRNRAATKWMKSEAQHARDAVAGNRDEEAFGIATTLTREAKKRKLAEVDTEHIQPVLTEAVKNLLPAKMGPPLADGSPALARRAARELIAPLDKAGATVARQVAAKVLRENMKRENEAAAAAETAKRPATAYLHRAIADDYMFRVRSPEEQLASREAIDKIAGFWWMMDGAPSCEPLAEGTKKFILDRKSSGNLSKLRWTVTTCDLEPEVTVTQEQRTYQRLIKGVTVNGSRGPDTSTTINVRNSDGTLASTRTETTPGSYTPGGQTEDSYEDTTGIARVTRTKHRWVIAGKMSAEAPGEAAAEESFSISKEAEVEHWEILQASPGDTGTSGGSDAAVLATAKEAVSNASTSFVFGVTNRVAMQRASRLADLAAAASTPEEAEELSIASIRTLGKTHPTATAFLEKRLNIPGDDIVALITTGGTPDGESSLAFKLAVPAPAADAEAMRGTEERTMTTISRHHSGDKIVELAAAVAEGGASTDPMGAGEGASTLGLGLGLTYGVIVDPGTAEGGILFDAAMDFRLGYAGAVFYDFSVPLSIGYRSKGIGVTLESAVGWDKFGADDSEGLHLNTGLYYGYGLGVSYLTPGRFDISASYLTMGRMDVVAETDFVLSDEDRLDLRLMIHQSMFGGVAVTARYAHASGEFQAGHVFTVWVGKVGY